MTIFGAPILVWILRIIVGIICFVLVLWLLPLAFAAVKLSPPALLVDLVAWAVLIAVVAEGYWRPRLR